MISLNTGGSGHDCLALINHTHIYLDTLFDTPGEMACLTKQCIRWKPSSTLVTYQLA